MGFLAYQHTRIFGAAAPGAGQPIHKALYDGANSVTPRRPGAALRITFSFAADTTLKHRVVSNGTTKDFLLKEGVTFVGGTEYMIEMATPSAARATTAPGEFALTHDFVQGTDVPVDLFLVEEIQEAVS